MVGTQSGTKNAFAYNSNNQINIGSFDNNGNATSYDPTANRSYEFVYDYEDYPTSVTGGRFGTMTMAYRADGLRAWKETATFGRKYFLYDGDQIICELDGQGNFAWSYGYGPNGLSQGWDRYNYSVYMWDMFGSFVGKAYQSARSLSG